MADLKAEAGSIRPAQSFLRLKSQVLRSRVAFPSLRLDPSMGITARGGTPFTFREVLSGTRHRPNCWAHVGGSAILASWIIVALLLRVNGEPLAEIWSKTRTQMWGALLVGVFIFGLAYVYNYSGMAASRRLSRPSAPPSS